MGKLANSIRYEKEINRFHDNLNSNLEEKMDDKFNILYERDLEYFIKYNIDQLKLEYISEIIVKKTITILLDGDIISINMF